MTTEMLKMYLVESAPASALQLHVRPGPGVCCALFGWDVVPPPVDDGPPPIVEAVFAAALVRCGSLAFLTDSGPPGQAVPRREWSLINDDHWTRWSPTVVDRLLRRRLPWIMATRDPDRARTLFSGASWSQQYQVGFVLRDGQLPSLTRDLVVTMVSARAARIDDLGLPGEVLALIAPAVDGDFLEVVAREQSTQDAIRAAIAAECENRGIPFDSRPFVPFHS